MSFIEQTQSYYTFKSGNWFPYYKSKPKDEEKRLEDPVRNPNNIGVNCIFFVNNISQNSSKVQIDQFKSKKISHLKQAIFESELSVPFLLQRIYFLGHECDNDQSLIDLGFMNNCTVYVTINHDHSFRTEAYDTFVLLGVLIFGFGIGLWFSFDADIFENRWSEILFGLFLSVAISLSGIGTMIFAAELYRSRLYLHLRQHALLDAWSVSTSLRKCGRISIMVSIISVFIMLSIHSTAVFMDDTAGMLTMSIFILSIASILVIFIIIMPCLKHRENLWVTNIMGRNIKSFMYSENVEHLSNLQKVFHYAAKNDVENVKKIGSMQSMENRISEEDNITSIPGMGGLIQNTALHWAATFGCLEAIEEIYMLGADLNKRNARGMTALQIASELGHVGIVDFLVKKCAETQLKDREKNLALHYAVSSGNVKSVRILLESSDETKKYQLLDKDNWNSFTNPPAQMVQPEHVEMKNYLRDLLANGGRTNVVPTISTIHENKEMDDNKEEEDLEQTNEKSKLIASEI